MRRHVALMILNPILAILVLNQVVTGLLHDSLPEQVFELLHVGGGILLAIGAALHLILNWNWIRASYSKSAPAARE